MITMTKGLYILCTLVILSRMTRQEGIRMQKTYRIKIITEAWVQIEATSKNEVQIKAINGEFDSDCMDVTSISPIFSSIEKVN